MNYRLIANVLGNTLLVEAGFLLLPLLTALYYAFFKCFGISLFHICPSENYRFLQSIT